MMKRSTGLILIILLVVLASTIAMLGVRMGTQTEKASGNDAVQGEPNRSTPNSKQEKLTLEPPSMDDVPEGPYGDAIKRGHDLITNTSDLLRKESSSAKAGEARINSLNCTSCHANAGLQKGAIPLVGMTTAYPSYNKRADAVMTIEDRINGCMVRSMNGEVFESGDPDLAAMVSYLSYVSEGVPIGSDMPWREPIAMEDVPVPDTENGEALFQQSCATCHATDGSGTGAQSGPALWGDDSFNDGAGLNRHDKMSGYIYKNMPKTDPGSLSEQEASDLAAFILMQDRPEWDHQKDDWADGGRPGDLMDKKMKEKLEKGEIDWEQIVKKDME